MPKTDVVTVSDELTAELKTLAEKYVEDNIRFPTEMDFVYTQSAMMIGVLAAMRVGIDKL